MSEVASTTSQSVPRKTRTHRTCLCLSLYPDFNSTKTNKTRVGLGRGGGRGRVSGLDETGNGVLGVRHSRVDGMCRPDRGGREREAGGEDIRVSEVSRLRERADDKTRENRV